MYSTWKSCFELQIEAQCLCDPWATFMVGKQQLKTKKTVSEKFRPNPPSAGHYELT